MLFILEQGGVYMLIDFTIDKYPELNHKICYTSLGNLLIKKTVSREDYDKFIKEKLNTESQMKYLVKLHRFDNMKDISKRKIYVYYIPSDIYKYMKYEKGKISSKCFVPENLKEKFKKCSIYIEIDLNYLSRIVGCNFICSSNFDLRHIVNISKPLIIIIPSKKDKVSIYESYNTILKHPYIKDYEMNYEEELKLIDGFMK